MKQPLQNIRDAAQHIKLSQEEKSLMRSNLLVMAKRNPAASRPQATPYFFFSYQRLVMPIAVFLIVALGGTTTYAAQGALPGGLLYPVKIYVNENIQETLALSDEAKASFHRSAAGERLKEAEALASQGKLSEEATNEIEENFNKHVVKAETLAMSLEESDPAVGVEARASLDSFILAHSSILEHIGGSSNDEKTKENSSKVARRVSSRGSGATVIAIAAKVAPAEASIEESVSFSLAMDASSTLDEEASTSKKAVIDSLQEKIAKQLEKSTSKQLEAVHETYDSIQESLSASTTVKVESQLAELNRLFDEGKSWVEAGDFGAARETFTNVIKGSIELKTLIKASRLYKRDFFGDDTDEDNKDEKDRD